MKTLVFANHKGGVGKSTLAVHQAFHAAEQNARVLFVDLDPQANSTSTLQQFSVGIDTLALFNEKPIRMPMPAGGGITLIGATGSLADTDRLPFDVMGVFVRQLQTVSTGFDICIVDTSPGGELRRAAALLAADFVVTPVELESYSLDGVTSLYQVIMGIARRWNHKLEFIGMLPSRFNSHSPGQKAALLDLLKNYSNLVLPMAITLRTSIPEALAEKIPVWKLPKTSARDAGKEMKEAMVHIATKMGGYLHVA